MMNSQLHDTEHHSKIKEHYKDIRLRPMIELEEICHKMVFSRKKDDRYDLFVSLQAKLDHIKRLWDSDAKYQHDTIERLIKQQAELRQMHVDYVHRKGNELAILVGTIDSNKVDHSIEIKKYVNKYERLSSKLLKAMEKQKID